MAETEHGLVDSGIRFVFDPDKKAFINQSKTDSIVQFSHNSERFTFVFPRYVRGHDMSCCNVAEIHYNNKRARSRDEQKGVVPILDLHIDGKDPDTVTFSWTVSGAATGYAGMLCFIAVLKCTDPMTGEVFYALPTETYCRLRVRGSMDNGEAMEEEYEDLLEGWKAEVLGEVNGILANAAASEAARQGAEEKRAAAEEARQSAEEERTAAEAARQTNEQCRIAAEAERELRVTVTGSSLAVSDAANRNILGLRVVGDVSQSGTPTPSAPLPFRCVGAGTAVRILDHAGELVGAFSTPCDLYAGDIWHPLTGEVERHSTQTVLGADTELIALGTSPYFNYYMPCSHRIHTSRCTHYVKGVAYDAVRENAFYDDFNAYAFYFKLEQESVQAVKDFWQSQKEAGTPVTVVYSTEEPSREVYEPKPLFLPLPKGTVSVLQDPVDLRGTLEMEYAADTKLYIDNKLAELQAMILEG